LEPKPGSFSKDRDSARITGTRAGTKPDEKELVEKALHPSFNKLPVQQRQT
jgi:hypothetical protein